MYTQEEIINFSGFKSEFHSVQTADGYILGFHRVVSSNTAEVPAETPNLTEVPAKTSNTTETSVKAPNTTKVPATNTFPVLLQHGVLADSSCWMCVGKDNSLPFVLARAGLDVWVSSSRGTVYSRDHVTLDADEGHEFWEFTWQDMSQKDLPAFVDHILKVVE